MNRKKLYCVREEKLMVRRRGRPRVIVRDNGSELTSAAVLRWSLADSTGITSRRAKPVQNTFVESFNSRLCDECLNEHVFLSLAEAQATIEACVAITTVAVRIRASAR